MLSKIINCLYYFIYIDMYRQSFLGEFKEDKWTVSKKYLESTVSGVRLYHTKFTPPQPKYTIAIIHGFGEHSGRFHQIAKFFASHNYEALLIDLTGFGYSGGPRGCSTVEVMVNDVIRLLTQARPQLPLFMYAHSMGGLLTVKLLLTRPEMCISGVILTSPFLGLPADRKFPKAKLWVVKQIGDDLQDLIINAMINPTALTKNNKYLHNIFQDRLMLPFLSVKMAKSLFEGVDEVRHEWHRFNFPIIVFHGKQDLICNYKNSKQFVEKRLSEYRKLYLFDRGYHELQHDQEKDELLEQGLRFLESLPQPMKRAVGNVIYSDLALKSKPKSHKVRNGVKIVILLGILFFLYRRFFRK